jgi:hypothetical protein
MQKKMGYFMRNRESLTYWSLVAVYCNVESALILEAKAKLHRSGEIRLAADHAERRRILHAERGIVEHNVIESVQEVGRKDKGRSFCHHGALGQGEIEIPVREATQNATP